MAIGFGPTDHFSAGSNLHAQSSSKLAEETSAIMLDTSGNMEAESTGLDSRTTFENEYEYDGAGTDLETVLGAAGNDFLTKFGDKLGSGKIDELVLRFEAGRYPTVSVRGHDHTENGHSATTDGYCDASGIMPGSTTFGVPTLTGQTVGANASPISLEITLRATHVDRIGTDGNHMAGRSITFMAELSETFLGIPTTPAATGWTTDSLSDGTSPSEQNQDFDEYTYTAHRYFDGVYA